MLGTFIEKYYPYKKSHVDPIIRAQEYSKEQLKNNIEEASSMLSHEDCPLYHLEKIMKITLGTPDTYLHSGVDGFTSNEPYDWLIDTLANQTDQKCFDLDNSILDIEYITNKIVNPTIYLEKDIDFRYSHGKIIFKEVPTTKELFLQNVKIKATMYEDSLGFLFGNINKELAIILLYMYRFGMTKDLLHKFLNIFFDHPYLDSVQTITDIVANKVYTDKTVYTFIGIPNVEKGKTYERLTPITKNVTVKDFKQEDLYILDDTPVIHEYVERILSWGSSEWGEAEWGTGKRIKDTYYRNKNVYVCNIYNSTNNIDSNKLSYLMECLPIWLELNVIVNKNLSSTYEESSHDISVSDSVYGSSLYKKTYNGIYSYLQYGYSSWGSGNWGGKGYQKTCLVLSS